VGISSNGYKLTAQLMIYLKQIIRRKRRIKVLTVARGINFKSYSLFDKLRKDPLDLRQVTFKINIMSSGLDIAYRIGQVRKAVEASPRNKLKKLDA